MPKQSVGLNRAKKAKESRECNANDRDAHTYKTDTKEKK